MIRTRARFDGHRRHAGLLPAIKHTKRPSVSVGSSNKHERKPGTAPILRKISDRMKKTALFLTLILGCSFLAHAQKSKVISVFQLIETGKYTEAKNAIEDAIKEENTWKWYKTWYARGLLAQTAYQKGMSNNDKKKYELYPDQFYVAYESYRKAVNLDTRNRVDSQLPPLYVQLANDFQKLGEKNYREKHFPDALKAYEQALEIIQSPILAVRTDTNLIYNTALAAYQMKEWDKAMEYLAELHKDGWSPNASFLLYTISLQKEDTAAAEKILSESIDKYKDNQDMVLLLSDLYYRENKIGNAVSTLDTALSRNPSNYIYPYTKGLIRQKKQHYPEAIDAYKQALDLAPDEVRIYTGIGTCYYNIGVDIQARARTHIQQQGFPCRKGKVGRGLPVSRLLV